MSLSSLSFHGGHLFASSNAAYDFGTNDFTIEAWIKTLSGGTIIGNKSTGDGSGIGGFLLNARSDGTVKFATDNGVGFYEIDSRPCAICDGVWHHVAAVRQGSAILLYLDGETLSGTPRGNATAPLNVTNTLPLTLGIADQTQEHHREFLGNLVEVRLWNCARTVQEIQNSYCRRLAPETANLVGYWSAEYGLTLDFSATNNGAQISGDVATSTDAPAVGPDVVAPMLFLFRGVYNTAMKSGATSSWSPSGEIYVTTMGHVVQNRKVLTGVFISGNTITWPLQGNPTAGNITFLLSSTDSHYWPNGPQPKYDFQGWCHTSGNGQSQKISSANYQTRILETPTTFGCETDGTWQILNNGDLVFVKTANTPNRHVEVYIASADAGYYRGSVVPRHIGCGLILNVGSGKVLYTPNAAAGVPVTLAPKTVQINDHFCVYDNDQILHMRSGLALEVQGDLAAGSPIVLSKPAAGQAAQDWTFVNDGLIRLTQGSSLAIAVNTSQQPARLVLANAAADPLQQFITLSDSQFIWNGNPPNVLSGVASGDGIYTQVGASTKADNAPAELWYLAQDTIICAVNAQALAVSGQVVVGASLTLAPFNPTDTAQGFKFDHGQLIHTASGLPVKMVTPGGGVVLGTATDNGPESHWFIGPIAGPSVTATAQPRMKESSISRVAATANVTYRITVLTGDYIAAGTNDKVEIYITGSTGVTARVELKTSIDHTDPFEREQTDRFDVSHCQCWRSQIPPAKLEA